MSESLPQKESDPEEISVDAFRLQFTNYAHGYCESSQNTSTVTEEKKERIIRYLKNSKDEPSPRFRFWVRSKGFRIVQSSDGDGECVLALPPRGDDPNNTLYRRVPVIDEFFDIIYAAHCENGHVGQAQTFSAVKAMYAMVPRSLVIKFIEMCPQCSTSHIYMTKRRKAAMSQGSFITADKLAGESSKKEPDVQGIMVDHAAEIEEVTPNTTQLEVTNSLGQLLPSVVEIGGATVDTADMEDSSLDTPGLFSCHLCKHVFNRRRALQRHLVSHQDYRPSVPLQKTSPHGKKRRLNGFSPTFLNASSQRLARRKVILDVDSSPTVAQAIFLAASRPDLDLMAINCVAGRVSVLHACENALRVLKACGREDVHVCRGAEKSLLGLYGKTDNLSGIAWSRKVEGHIQAEHSVSSLIRCVNESPGEITLVCMGPLTNLALALRLDPHIATNLREVIIVGGNVEGQGDLSACAEQNFLFDPEAAHIVLQEVNDALILPYEISLKHSIPFKHYITWLNSGTDVAQFLVESVSQEEIQLQAKTGVVAPEMFAVAIVTDPSIILEKQKLYCSVELKGDYSRGLMVVDRRGHLGKPVNVYVVKNLDLGKTQALFGAMFDVKGQPESSGAMSSTCVSVVNVGVTVSADPQSPGSMVNLVGTSPVVVDGSGDVVSSSGASTVHHMPVLFR